MYLLIDLGGGRDKKAAGYDGLWLHSGTARYWITNLHIPPLFNGAFALVVNFDR